MPTGVDIRARNCAQHTMNALHHTVNLIELLLRSDQLQGLDTFGIHQHLMYIKQDLKNAEEALR